MLKIGSLDGFIFVTGEYNHSIPTALKMPLIL
jgi:NAD(P)H-dependent FMN reductase